MQQQQQQTNQMTKLNSTSVSQRQVLGGICVNTLGSGRSQPVVSKKLDTQTVLQLIYQQQQQGQTQSQSQSNQTVLQQQQQVNEQQQGSSTTRYKTELCRSFQENGICKYGDKCQFAHGLAELRNMIRHPKYKTELCRTFHAAGYCPYGPRCHFVHDTQTDAQTRASQLSPQLLTVKLTGSNYSSSSSSSSSSSGSTSSSNSGSSSTSPLSLNQFYLDEIDSLFVKTVPTTTLNPGSSNGNSLLMCANAMESSSKARKESTSSSSSCSSGVFSSYTNGLTSISPPSSRSLSPDVFLNITPNFGAAPQLAYPNNGYFVQDDEDDFKSTDLIVNQILSNIYHDNSIVQSNNEQLIDDFLATATSNLLI